MIITLSPSKEQTEHVLVNFASNEYCKSVQTKLLNGRILNTDFKESNEGKTRVIAIFAKRTRGMMTDFILRIRIDSAEDIKAFVTGGYKYSVKESTENNCAFTRPQPATI